MGKKDIRRKLSYFPSPPPIRGGYSESLVYSTIRCGGGVNTLKRIRSFCKRTCKRWKDL